MSTGNSAALLPLLIGLPVVLCSLVILYSGGRRCTAVSIAAYVAVLISAVGALAGAYSAFVAKPVDQPDCMLMAALCTVHVYLNALHFMDSKRLKQEAAKGQKAN